MEGLPANVSAFDTYPPRNRVEGDGLPAARPQHDHLDHRTTMPDSHRHLDLPLQAPATGRKPVPLEVPAIVRKRGGEAKDPTGARPTMTASRQNPSGVR